jgi:membrane-associated phospholipid phosphatase
MKSASFTTTITNPSRFLPKVRAVAVPVLLFVLLLLGLALLVWIDAPAARYFDAMEDGWIRGAFKSVGKLGDSTAYLGVSGLLALSLLRRPSLWGWRGWFMFASVAATGAGCILLKMLLGRPRPDAFIENGDWGFQFLQLQSDYWSFPSGHTTTAFGVASVAMLLWPRNGWIILLPALAVAVSRVVTGAHFPTDVLAGAWLGIAGTLLLWIPFRKPLERYSVER